MMVEVPLVTLAKGNVVASKPGGSIVGARRSSQNG